MHHKQKGIRAKTPGKEASENDSQQPGKVTFGPWLSQKRRFAKPSDQDILQDANLAMAEELR